MYPIEIIRVEIVCIVILLYLLYNSRLYSIGKDSKTFTRILAFSLGHVVFDLITVLTVNDPRTTESFRFISFLLGRQVQPPFAVFNWICHVIFYMFALLFVHEFLCYTVDLCYGRRVTKRVRKVSMAALVACLMAMPFLEMLFIPCRGTNSSYGPAAFAGYGLALVYFFVSLSLVIVNRSTLKPQVRRALIPMLLTGMIMELLQVVVPELLFTGATVTILSVGFFFSLENPIAVFKQKEQIDALTGVKTRNMYEQSIADMERDFQSGTSFTFVFGDINDLKYVNDMYGHLEGDQYIAAVARILTSALAHCEDIYRMGGDELMAIYRDCEERTVSAEIDAVVAACAEASKHLPYLCSLSVGYAVSNDKYDSLREVLRSADYQMYSNKLEMKKQRAYALLSKGRPNISGLTDRLFTALSDTDPSTFLFVLNLATDVCRWSAAAVRYFGLESEFMTQFQQHWAQRIDPDERAAVVADLRNCLSHVGFMHNMSYKIKNAADRYVTVNCRGRVLHGKNGDPDLFAGRIIVLDSADTPTQ